jgi:hypothetical protein
MPKKNWTQNNSGVENSSPLFNKLCGEVERLIRHSAHDLIGGRAGTVAALIVAQLAHIHGLAPATPRRKRARRAGA